MNVSHRGTAAFRRLVAAILVAAASGAGAVVLQPDQFVPLPGTDATATPSLAGTVLAHEVVPAAFPVGDGSRLVMAQVEAKVLRSTATGTLDFYWKVMVQPHSEGWVQSFSLYDVMAAQYDTDWRRDDAGGVAPTGAWLFPGDPAPTLQYSFTDAQRAGLGAGEQSFSFFLRTSARTYTRNGSFDLAGIAPGEFGPDYGGTGPIATFAPSPVPEPAALAMFAAGAFVLAMARRRR